MRRLATAAAMLGAGPAWADVFRTADLTDVDTSAFAAELHDRSREPDRLTLAQFMGQFMGEGFAAVDLELARSTDGTDGCVRSGTMTIADREADGEAPDLDCGAVDPTPLGGAVGWRTRTRAMEMTTHVLIQDHDMPTIRAMGEDRVAVDAPAALAFDVPAPQIVAP